MKKNIRRQLIVNPNLQYKMMFLILVSVLFPTVLVFMSLYHLIASILLEANMNDPMVYNALLFVTQKIYLILVLGFVAISVLLVTWGLIFIHRIVGPLYRLEKELDKFLAGKTISKIRFRKNDAFHTLADKINLLIEKLHNK